MTVRTAPLTLLVMLIATALLSACSSKPRVTETDTTTSAGLSEDKNNQNAKPEGEYIIGAGDSLSVFVYRNPDLSEGGVAVRPDGRISVPLIEDIVAAGKTPTQLARDIEERLKKYIQDPNVTVIVRSFIGPANRQIKVIGEATEPQAIPYREGMTLLDVMIATKGLTKFASGNRAVIVRRLASGKQETIHVHLDDLLKDGDISQNVPMRPGDTLIIPQSWF